MMNAPQQTLKPTFAAAFAEWWRQPLNRLVAAGFVLYAIVLSLNMGAYAGGPDPAGYLNNAKLISKGMIRADRTVWPGADVTQLDPETFVPAAFVPVEGGKMVAFHPAGLPIAVAAMSKITGWDAAPHVTMVIVSLLGVLVAAWLVRAIGLPWGWAWTGALMLAGSSLYLNMSVRLLSDVPAELWVTLSVILAWKSRKRDASNWWALVAGVAVAGAVFVRPTNALVMLPVAVCLGLPWQTWKRWLLLGIGGFPGGVLWCLYNHAANGHYLEPGYTGGNGSAMFFSLSYVPETLVHYARWVPLFLTPLCLAIFALPFFWKRAPRLVLMLLVWIVPFFAFYATYQCTHLNYEFVRFVLPAFPACIAGVLWVIHGWLQMPGGMKFDAKLGGKALLWVALFALAFDLVILRLKHLERAGRVQAYYAHAAYWAGAHLPADAFVVGKQMTGAIYCYTQFPIARIDHMDAQQWAEVSRAAVAAHRPVYAALFWFDLPDADAAEYYKSKDVAVMHKVLTRDLPGKWKQIGMVDTVTFWQLETADVAKP